MYVRDPSQPSQPVDYFASKFHDSAHKMLLQQGLPSGQLSVSTSLPLAGSEPLVGIRSMSCADFTAFTLQFHTVGPITADVSKYSNGCSGISAEHVAGPTVVRVHAKSSGFDETASGRFTVDYKYSERISGQIRTDFPDLNSQRPSNVSVASELQLSKNVVLISQMNHDTVNTTGLSSGLKFQPCAHMQAGVGVDRTNPLSKLAVTRLVGNLFFETHAGSRFGLMGRVGGNSKPDFNIAASTKLISALENHPETSVQSPVLGLQYDTASQTICSYMQLGVSAGNGAKSRMNLGLKLGMRMDAKSMFAKSPVFTLHVTASES